MLKECFPTNGDFSLVNYVEFQTSLSDTKAYSLYSQSYLKDASVINDNAINLKSNNINENVYKQEYYCNGKSEVIINDLEKTYVTSQDNTINLEAVCDIANEERITIEEDGEPCYNYKTNPTNLPEVSICLFPQEMAFGFLADQELWEIEDVQTIDGRSVYHIVGKTNEEYGNKLNVATFEFFVDVNTGVLLKYIGYNEDNEISDYMFAENISFDKQAESVKMISQSKLNGYKETSLF